MQLTKNHLMQEFSSLISKEVDEKQYSYAIPETAQLASVYAPREVSGHALLDLRAFDLSQKLPELVRYIVREDYKSGKIGLWRVTYKPTTNERKALFYCEPSACVLLSSMVTYHGIICTEQERAAYQLKHRRRMDARELHPHPVISKARALAYLRTKKGCKNLTEAQLLGVRKSSSFTHRNSTQRGLSYVFFLDKPKNYRVAAYRGLLNPSSVTNYWERSIWGTVKAHGFTVECW